MDDEAKQVGSDDSAAQPGTKWGDPISEARQAELRALFERQKEWAAQPEAARGESMLKGVRLTGADVFWLADMSGRTEYGQVPNLHLEWVDLSSAQLEGANLAGAHLEGANLADAGLKGADLRDGHLEGAYLVGAKLVARLQGAYLDATTRLNEVSLTDGKYSASLADVRWGNANLTVIDWQSVKFLGDELEARARTRTPSPRPRRTRTQLLMTAVQAYKQLSAVLRAQGLVEDANRFGYRGLVLQRRVFRRQGKFGQYCFALLRDTLSGYGYRSARSFQAYLTVICTFAIVYYWYALYTHAPISPTEAVLVSLVSFHGRGFLTGGFPITDFRAGISLTEAVIGVFIEAAIVAAFTQHPDKD